MTAARLLKAERTVQKLYMILLTYTEFENTRYDFLRRVECSTVTGEDQYSIIVIESNVIIKARIMYLRTDMKQAKATSFSIGCSKVRGEGMPNANHPHNVVEKIEHFDHQADATIL